MIMGHEKICADYRISDVTRRLHIFLQYPELRNDFIEIELGEPPAEYWTQPFLPRPINKVLKCLKRIVTPA
jgi:hypothetical protein